MSFGGGASLGSASGEIILNVDRAQANVKQLQGTINQFGATAGDSISRVATGLGLLAAAKGIGNLFGGAITGAANFEQAMDGVGAALGGVGEGSAVTTEQFKALNEEALRIGSTTSKSATEAAVAMDLMAKAGVGLDEILNGGAQGAVNLAEATGEALPQAAQTLSSVLNLFENLDPQKATDILAAGLGQSSATLSEFETGIARLAPAIGIVGLSAEEAAAGVAYFNKQGLSAAESGSSLNSAILALASPTGDAAIKMAELGISAFDANHQFIGFPALMDQVATATAGMGDDTKAAALELIFGRDALDVMGIAAEKGGDGLRDATVEVSKLGTAATASAQRMDNFKGSLEQFRGAIETVAIRVGTLFLPVLRQIVDVATLIVTAFASLPDPILALAGGATIAAAAMAGLAGAMVLIGPRMAEFGQALAVVRKAMFSLVAANPALLALVATVALFGIAYKTNFGGFADFVDDKLSFVQRRFGYFTKGFGRTFKGLDRTFKGTPFAEKFFTSLGVGLRDALGIQGRAGDAFIAKFSAIGRVANEFEQGVGRMTGALGDISRIIQRDGLAEGIDRLFGDKGRDLVRGFGESLGTLPKVFGGVLGAITTGFGPLDSILANAGRGFEQLGRSVELLFAGDFSGAGETLQNAVDRFLSVGDTAFGTVVDVAVNIGNWLVGVATSAGSLGQKVYDEVQEVWPAVKDAIGEAWSALVTIGTWFVNASASLGTEVRAYVDRVWPGVKGFIGTAWQVTLTIGQWFVNAAVSLGTEVRRYVDRVWPGVQGFIGSAWATTVTVGTWFVNASVSLGTAVRGYVGRVWPGVKGFIGSAWATTLTIGQWFVNAAVSLGEAVRGYVDRVWPGVKGFLGSAWQATLTIGKWFVGAADSLGTRVREYVDRVWPGVQGFIGSAWETTVKIGTWIAEEAKAGTLVQSVQDKADGLLASAGVEITNFKLTIGALGIENVDFSGVTDFFTKPIEFPAGTAESANAWGYKIGDAIQSLIRSAVNAFGGSGGSGVSHQEMIAGGGKASNLDSLGDVASEFIGGLIEGLLVNIVATIDKTIADAKARLTEIVAPITEFFGDIGAAITGAFSGGGQIDNRSGQQLGGTDPGSIITDLIAGIFDFKLPEISLPDFGPLVTKIFDGIVAAITPDKGFEVLVAIAQSLATKAGDFASEGAAMASSLWSSIKQWFVDNATGLAGEIIDTITGGLSGGDNENFKPNAEGVDRNGDPIKQTGMPSAGAITEVAASWRAVGLAGSQGAANGFVDGGPELRRRISEQFQLGDGEATSSGVTKGALHGAGIAAGIASKMPTIQANIRTALAAASGGGSAPPQQGGAPPKAAQTAPAAVVIPAPNLTLYVAGLGRMAAATVTAMASVGLVAAGLALSFGMAAGSATTAFNTALVLGFVTAATVTVTAIGAIGLVAGTLTGTMGLAASTAMSTFTQAIAVGMQGAYGAVSTGLGSIAGLAAGFSLSAEGNSIGASLGDGIAVGIASSAAIVAAAAAGVVNVAVRAAETAAETGSPSRLFARKIGVPIGQGVAVGITSTRPLVNTSMANLIGGIPAQSVSTAQLIGSQSTGRTAASGGGTTYVRVINAVKSDEMVRLIRQSEKGGAVFDYMEELPRAMTTVRSGG